MPLLSSKDAAAYLSVSDSTLRKSRVYGTLCGLTAPHHFKMGTIVRYDRDQLDEWLSQLITDPADKIKRREGRAA